MISVAVFAVNGILFVETEVQIDRRRTNPVLNDWKALFYLEKKETKALFLQK